MYFSICVSMIPTTTALQFLAGTLTVHLLEVDALNVEEDMDLIPSIKFLAHYTGLRLSQLEGKLAGNRCSLRSKFPHQEIRRWTKGGAGMFARRVGNLLQPFSCVHKIAPIMEMNSCFAEIPVLIDGIVHTVHRCRNTSPQGSRSSRTM